MTKKKIIKIIQDNLREIKAYDIKEVGLFGSYAKYQQHQKSDIDILIEFKKNKESFDNYMDLKFFLEKLLNRKVDLTIKNALKPRIKSIILKETEYARL